MALITDASNWGGFITSYKNNINCDLRELNWDTEELPMRISQLQIMEWQPWNRAEQGGDEATKGLRQPRWVRQAEQPPRARSHRGWRHSWGKVPGKVLPVLECKVKGLLLCCRAEKGLLPSLGEPYQVLPQLNQLPLLQEWTQLIHSSVDHLPSTNHTCTSLCSEHCALPTNKLLHWNILGRRCSSMVEPYLKLK